MTPFLNLAHHISALAASLSMEVMTVSTGELQGLFVEALDDADCQVLHRISDGHLYVHPFAAMAVHSSWLARVADLLCVDADAVEGAFLGRDCELSEAALADLMRACAAALMKASDDIPARVWLMRSGFHRRRVSRWRNLRCAWLICSEVCVLSRPLESRERFFRVV